MFKLTKNTKLAILSVLIAIHLFCVTISVFNDHVSSRLFQNISANLFWYTQTIGLDGLIAHDYHLTHAITTEDDHHFEIEIAGQEQPTRLPDVNESRAGRVGRLRFEKFQNFIRPASFAASMEDDSTLAQYARCIGTHLLGTTDSERMVVRLMAYQPISFRDSNQIDWTQLSSSFNYVSLYEADVWKGEDGRINVHKSVPTAEAAPLAVRNKQ